MVRSTLVALVTCSSCVKDGINASRQVTRAIAKVARIVSHVKRSAKATEKFESLFVKCSFLRMKLVGTRS